jgi:hypothetical protein
VCVTGMHRSGTSFAARALEALGVSFGDPQLLMQPGPDNPAGYWENRSIKELDDDLLTHLGGSWDSPPVLDPEWAADPGLEEFRVRAVEILDETFGPSASRPAMVGWKDPRLSLLLAFWRTVTPVTTTIVIVRDPIEVAASLEARNEMQPPQACLLWLRYLLAAIESDPTAMVLRHRAFFDDTADTLRAMAEHLSLAEPDDDAVREVQRHLDPSLHHHVASDEADEHENPIVSLAASVWNAGEVRTDVVPASIASAIARGWLRPPVDTLAFDRARARNVDLTELLRRRSRKRAETEDGA